MTTSQTSRLSALGWAFVAVMAAAGVWLLVGSSAPWPTGVILLAVAACIASLRVRTSVRDDVLFVRMPPFPSRVIHLTAIRGLQVHDSMPWGAIGYRWFGPRMWGMVTGGPEITIHFDGDQTLIASCRDPRALQRELADRVLQLTGRQVAMHEAAAHR